MVLVIAIIVILAAVLVMNIGTYLNKAKSATDSVDSHNHAISEVVDVIDANV
jgi:type II secretory pathway pseudopilin PulG